MAQTLQHFLSETVKRTSASPAASFEVESERFLKINFGFPSGGPDGAPLSMVWIKKGSMVAYQGEVKFEREGVMEHGIKHALKKAFTDEGADLVKATCRPGFRSELFLAHKGKRVMVLRLTGDAVVVNGTNLLAFEPSINHKIVMMKKLSGIASGGLFNVRLEGQGFVAILAHGKPIALSVAPGCPLVFTDPQATVAWSGNLVTDFHTDVSFKTFIGRGSGEGFQMKFDASRSGPGFVVVQPYEEETIQQQASYTTNVGDSGTFAN